MANGEPFRIVGFLGWAPRPKPGGGSGSLLLPALGGAAAALAVALVVGLVARHVRRRAT
jgi:hypothetical protein